MSGCTPYNAEDQLASWEDEGGSSESWRPAVGSTLPSREGRPPDNADPRFGDQRTLTMLKTGLMIVTPALGAMAVFWSLAA